MNESFETLGNATLQLFADGRPVLATDPWLVGTCYFGSWALDHALTDQQIRRAHLMFHYGNRIRHYCRCPLTP